MEGKNCENNLRVVVASGLPTVGTLGTVVALALFLVAGAVEVVASMTGGCTGAVVVSFLRVRGGDASTLTSRPAGATDGRETSLTSLLALISVSSLSTLILSEGALAWKEVSKEDRSVPFCFQELSESLVRGDKRLDSLGLGGYDIFHGIQASYNVIQAKRSVFALHDGASG